MDYWVFGYGSLIWKPPYAYSPHAIEKRSGYVKGVVRRFAQSSIDHRGTPEAPGRVVTVIEAATWHDQELKGSMKGDGARVEGEGDDEDWVWGVAYRIDLEKEVEVRAYLGDFSSITTSYDERALANTTDQEHREKNGYTPHEVPVYCSSPDGKSEIVAVENATIWIGKLDNPAFVGYEVTSELAQLIHQRSGPSGANKDYLYKLAESVRELYPHVRDDYLFELDAAVRALDADLRCKGHIRHEELSC